MNTDLIYQKVFARFEPITLSQAVVILIHELGHHQGLTDHRWLDFLGTKVASVLDRSIARVPLTPFSEVIQATILNDPVLGSYPQVLIRVGDRMLDASKLFRNEVACPSLHLPLPISLPTPSIQLDRPSGAMFHNVHWQNQRHGLGKTKTVSLKGNLSAVCKDRKVLKHLAKYYNMTVSFKIHINHETVSYVEDSLAVSRRFEPWWEIVRWAF